MTSAKITQLNLKNYKVFDEVTLDLNNCNVFVGPNASGKSSMAEFLVFFREAVKMFSSTPQGWDYDMLKNFLNTAFRIGQQKPLEFSFKLLLKEKMYEYNVIFFTKFDVDAVWANEKLRISEMDSKKEILKSELSIEGGEYPSLECLMRITDLEKNIETSHGGAVDFLNNSILRKENYSKFDNSIKSVLDPLYNYWNQIKLYDFNEYDKKIITSASKISDDITLAEDFHNLLKVLLNLNFQQKDTFTMIKDWLSQLLPDFKDLIIQTSTTKGDAFIAFSENNWDVYAPITQASDGIIRLLCILTILFNKEKPSLIILDEPENGIHPAIRKYIADFSIAASDEAQLFFLTHDSESLRQFDLEMIYYFKRKSGSTEVRQLSKENMLTDTIKALNDVEKDTIVSTHSTNSL